MSARAGWACAAATTLVAAVLAACSEGAGPGQCFEPNVLAYGFTLNGDSTIVFHWPSSYMPIRVYAEPVGALQTNVQNAMALWESGFRCGEASLTLTADSTHADIIARNPVSLPVGVLGTGAATGDSVNACHGVTAFAFDSTGKALSGPVRVYVAAYPGMDSASVASCYHFATAHELGHALGIWAHSADTNDLMYPTPHRAALSEADRYTIQLLYHTAATIAPPVR